MDEDEQMVGEGNELSPEITPDPQAKPVPQSNEEQNSKMAERLRAENEAYRHYFATLQMELDEIAQKYPLDNAEITIDPVKALSSEVGELKNGFAQLREMIEKSQQPAQSQPQGQATQSQAQQNYQTWAPYPPQTVYPQQQSIYSSPIFSAAPLPYIQTPNYAPQVVMPPMPGINNNFNGGR